MRVVGLLATSAMLLSLSVTEAASAWVCRATSSTGSWGAGWHTSSKSYAKKRALLECAVRTPRGRTCYIRFCKRR